MGVEQLYILRFAQVRDFTPEEFVSEILIGVCHAKEVCCGFNFTFGRGGRANSQMLSRICSEHGIRAEVADAVLFDGEPVSSTRIRGLIASGDVDEAAELWADRTATFPPCSTADGSGASWVRQR